MRGPRKRAEPVASRRIEHIENWFQVAALI